MNSCIYKGTIGHQRRGQARNEFRYSLFMMYLDLAELDQVFSDYWFWSTENTAPARFRRSDHFGPADSSIEVCVRDLILQKTGRSYSGAIRLLTHLSYFGHCFNPLSVYYCYDEQDVLRDVILEVSNTPWGEQHCYLLSAENRTSNKHFHFQFSKNFHVSPFMPLDMDYVCRLTEPDESLFVALNNYKDGNKVFSSQLALQRREINSRNLASALATDPLMTMRVKSLIHWQAAKLWIKRARYYDHPGNTVDTASQNSPDVSNQKVSAQ